MDLNLALKTAKDPEALSEQLDALFEHGEEVDRLLARHTKASADLLEKLSHSSDKTTRKYVVGNPNATKDVLVKLAPQFPGDFFKNPAFDWLLIEQPNLMFEIGGGVLKNVLKRPECPESFLNWAAAHGSEQEKLAVAMNPVAPRAALEQLVATGGAVADAAKAHANLQLSAEYHDPVVELERQVKLALAELDDYDARQCWRRGLIGPAQWVWLNPLIRLNVLGFSQPFNLDGKSDRFLKLYKLASDFDPEVRNHKLAENPALTLADFFTQAMSRNLEIRKQVAKRLDAPAEICEKLARDPKKAVRYELAQNTALTLAAIAILAMDSDYEVRGRLARNAAVPPFILEGLSTDRYQMVRDNVAGNPATPRDVLAKLAENCSLDTRLAVAGNASTPASVLVNMPSPRATGDRDRLLARIAGNCATPIDFLISLANHHEISVRIAIYENTATPFDLKIEVFNSLLNEKSSRASEWRYDLAEDSDTPVELLDQLARKSGRTQPSKLRAAGNPLTPISEIEKFARSKNIDIQLAVGANPAAPESIRTDILTTLAERAGLPGFWGFSDRYTVPQNIRQRAEDLSSARRWWHELELFAKRELLLEMMPKCLPAADELFALYREEMQLVRSNPTNTLVARMMGAQEENVLNASTALQSEASCNLPDGKWRAVRLLGLLYPHCRAAVLINRYRSVDWVERLAVAHNISAPAYVMSTLKKDPHQLVVQQAKLTADKQRALFPSPPSTVNRVTMKSVVAALDVSPVTPQAFTAPCPNCKGTVREDNGDYACCGVEGAASGCGFSFNKTQAGRVFKPAEVDVLLREHKSGLLRGFISKAGKPFNAEMVLRFDLVPEKRIPC